jgi:hypothetical protein
MIDAGVSASLGTHSFGFLPAGTWQAAVANTATAWVSLADGNFFSLPVNKADLLTFTLGALALLALAAVLVKLLVLARSWWIGRVASPASDEEGTRELFIAFWGTALILTLGSFALTLAESGGVARYLLGAWVAAAALLGSIPVTRQGRVAVTICLAVMSGVIIRDNITFGIPPPAAAYPEPTIRQIERFVTAHDATTGFADYFYSASVTWATDFRVKVYPVWPCDAGRPGLLCQRDFASDSAWFIPRRHTRSFLITGAPTSITAVPRSFGSPIATASFGQFTVSIYNHDVAADLQEF